MCARMMHGGAVVFGVQATTVFDSGLKLRCFLKAARLHTRKNLTTHDFELVLLLPVHAQLSQSPLYHNTAPR
jgi:hypothetical protein